MKIDVVIPHRNEYPHRDLIYCLRSLQQNVTDLGRIIIVGDLPRVITGVEHIQANDRPGYKNAARNIFTKLQTAFEICKQALVVHDDHFLLNPTSSVDYPYYHRGQINPLGKPYGYEMLLRNTIAQFPGTNDFDVHCPIFMTRDGLNNLESLDWNKPFGYGIKTAYCYLNNINGEYFEDLKIKSPMNKEDILKLIEGRNVFSTGSGAYTGQIEKVLKQLFPKPSRYEKTGHLV